jgi:hypothetical protein
MSHGCCAELRKRDSQPRAQVPAPDPDDGHEDDQQPIEMGGKVDLQSDAGKEKRYEYRINHLGDNLARPLGELFRLPRHDPGEEEPEQRVDADPLGNRAAQHAEQDDKRQCRPRLGHFPSPDLQDRRVRQPSPEGQAKHGKADRAHEDDQNPPDLRVPCVKASTSGRATSR